MSRDVVTNFKETIECPCTDEKCPREGFPSSRRFLEGVRHVKGCPCIRCRGRESKNGGGAAQRMSRKRHGITNQGSLAHGNEENERGPIRREAKSGAQVRPMATAFYKAKDQSDLTRAFGDNRPYIFDAIPDPKGKAVITCFEHRSSDEYKTAVYALAQLLGFVP